MIELEPLQGEIFRIRMARDLPGLRPYFTIAYLVDGLMVDSGCAHTVDELLGLLRREGLRVCTVVNTHHHEDHIAGNARLHAEHGARLLAHRLALPVLADPRRRQPQQLYRRLMWGYPAPSRAEPLEDKETVQTAHHLFRVIHTPGHSPDHISLFEPERGWLFTGDAYVGGRDQALRADSDVWQIIDSLRKLRLLQPGLLLPGCASVNRDPDRALARKIAYLEQLGRQVLDLHQRGLRIEQIRRRIFGWQRLFFVLTRGDFDGASLVRSFVENQPATRR